MTKMRLCAIGSAIAIALSSASAQAALIEGTGLFGAGTATTAVSRANQSFQFSFEIPATLDSSNGVASTSANSNFTYTLNGMAVSVVPTLFRFYTLANGGLFDILLNDGTTINFYGADIGSDGSLPPTSAYTFAVGINGAETGQGFLTVTNAAVPEPATWATMVAGIGMLGFAMRRRKVRTTVRFA